jgi:DUF1365 family protein
MSEIFLGKGETVHERFGLAAHRFAYPTFFLQFSLKDEAGLRSLFRGPFRFFFSLRAEDYLEGKSGNMDSLARDFLRKRCGDFEPAEIRLVTMPRIFGYVFNPVSFWLCFRNGRLEAALSEVNNTFGERHFYWIEPGKDGSLSGWRVAEKRFHVSPFLPVSGTYQFYFRTFAEHTRIDVNYFNEEGKLTLATWLAGALSPLDRESRFSLALQYGWHSALVVARIHWQAILLWRKRAVFHRKPQKPVSEVSS